MKRKRSIRQAADLLLFLLTITLAWSTIYFYRKAAAPVIATNKPSPNCDLCRATTNSSALKPDTEYRYRYRHQYEPGPDTSRQIYRVLYQQKEYYKSLSESTQGQLMDTESKLKDSIATIQTERKFLARLNINLIANNDQLKDRLNDAKKYKHIVDTMRTVEYQKSYELNPEVNQVLLQLRSAYSFNRPGVSIGAGAEYKTNRSGFNAAIFYNPFTDKVTESLGYRYDLFRTRIKLQKDTLKN